MDCRATDARLLKPSFIPDRPQRELRELVRYRRRVVQNKAQIANQMHKVLEGGNIKLASVATDILGVSGREMLRALIAGEKDSSVLAELARGLLRKKLEELRLALHGLWVATSNLCLESCCSLWRCTRRRLRISTRRWPVGSPL